MDDWGESYRYTDVSEREVYVDTFTPYLDKLDEYKGHHNNWVGACTAGISPAGHHSKELAGMRSQVITLR